VPYFNGLFAWTLVNSAADTMVTCIFSKGDIIPELPWPRLKKAQWSIGPMRYDLLFSTGFDHSPLDPVTFCMNLPSFWEFSFKNLPVAPPSSLYYA